MKRCRGMLMECFAWASKTEASREHKIFKSLGALHPTQQYVFSLHAQFPFPQLLIYLTERHTHEIEEQCRKLFCWLSKPGICRQLTIPIPPDIPEYWIGVRKCKNGAVKSTFNKVAVCALSCLTLSIWNAGVERIFSTVTLTKTKSRNRMKLRMLNILYVGL